MSKPSDAGELPMSLFFRAQVIGNSEVKKNHFVLNFTFPSDLKPPRPGQFFMVGVGTPIEPLLKRPFCFFGSGDEGIGILYRIRGKGTELLKELRPDDFVEIIGPLGTPYPMPGRGQRPVVVAGGVAIASVFPLIKKLKGRATVFYGAKGEGDLLMIDELSAMAGELEVSTDDGSYGTKGTVLDMLKGKGLDANCTFYACGPRGMTSAVVGYALEAGVKKGYASLEEFMACGIGACMGCVVMTSKGYKRVCSEGPVFKIGELVI